MEHGFKHIGVIGAGQMGHGIAQVAASAGLEVTLQDISEVAVQRGLERIETSSARLVKKELLSEEERDALLMRIRVTTDVEALVQAADVIIESATEEAEVKFRIFRDLDERCPPSTVLLTNTSSISITHIAGHTNRPDKIMGMHFMNPAPRMELVELIRGLVTAEETYERVRALGVAMGKKPVTAEDYPGFIVNRVLIPMINEACYALMERVGDVEDIDRAMTLGAHHPMGPFTLADFIGLDTCLSIMEVLQEGLGDAKYRPCPLLQRYVRAGFLGRKSGRGFYTYD